MQSGKIDVTVTSTVKDQKMHLLCLWRLPIAFTLDRLWKAAMIDTDRAKRIKNTKLMRLIDLFCKFQMNTSNMEDEKSL